MVALGQLITEWEWANVISCDRFYFFFYWTFDFSICLYTQMLKTRHVLLFGGGKLIVYYVLLYTEIYVLIRDCGPPGTGSRMCSFIFNNNSDGRKKSLEVAARLKPTSFFIKNLLVMG